MSVKFKKFYNGRYAHTLYYELWADRFLKKARKMEAKQIEPKGIMKIVKVVLGWIFGKQPKKPKNGLPKDKTGGYNSID